MKKRKDETNHRKPGGEKEEGYGNEYWRHKKARSELSELTGLLLSSTLKTVKDNKDGALIEMVEACYPRRDDVLATYEALTKMGISLNSAKVCATGWKQWRKIEWKINIWDPAVSLTPELRLFLFGGRGCGKTTSAAQLRSGLPMMPEKVLVISTDPAHSPGTVSGCR